MNETWLPIPDWEGLYEASSLGQIRSVDRTVTTKHGVRRAVRGVVLKPTRAGSSGVGHWAVHLSRENNGQMRYVHQLVALTFIGPRPEGAEVRHADDDRDNNAVENLLYGTRADNMQDAIRNGRNSRLNRAECAKGHPYDEENTGRTPSGGRWCRACNRAATAASYRKRVARHAA